MDYILRGDDKDVTNVFKEQRIWISRGMTQFIPISEYGLVTEEDARKTLECMLAEKNEETSRLAISIAEKDETIVELTEERETMKVRIAELEVQVLSDEKNLPVTDSKDSQEEDAKEVTVIDDKTASVEDEKKAGKDKASEQLSLC